MKLTTWMMTLLASATLTGVLRAVEAPAPEAPLPPQAAPSAPAYRAPAPQIQVGPPTVRIKDVADISGVRENQLIGQGIMVGLDGSGDKSGTLTQQELANFVARMGVNTPFATLKPKNVALVAITATLPPFIKKGAKIDVQVSSMGDATSLQGGVLLQVPLQGADGRVYAVAQGAISIGGFSAGSGGGGGAQVQKNHPLVGRIPNGAIVEREVPMTFEREGITRIALRRADITTAQRMAEAINKRWPGCGRAADPFTVEFYIPTDPNQPQVRQYDLMATLAELENLRFTPDVQARVAINERTGTIVAGAQVRLSPTVLSHGSLYITIKNSPIISQPGDFSEGGKTVVVQDQSTTTVEENGQAIVLQPGPTLGDLAAALNALKVKPRDIIAIFQALKEAGALNAELVIM